MKEEILNEVTMFLDALKDDVVNVKTNNHIKQSYNFKVSWIWVFSVIYIYVYIAHANEVYSQRKRIHTTKKEYSKLF